MAIAYVNIGSNLGDRKFLIEEAIRRISRQFGYYCVSGYVESDPWGYDSDNRFLNIGIAFRTLLPPEIILKKLQKIEREISEVSHRDSEGNYADREIDIDIMAIDEVQIGTIDLQIPHKCLKDRLFFLKPLQELAPDWTSPATGEKISELIKKCQDC